MQDYPTSFIQGPKNLTSFEHFLRHERILHNRAYIVRYILHNVISYGQKRQVQCKLSLKWCTSFRCTLHSAQNSWKPKRVDGWLCYRTILTFFLCCKKKTKFCRFGLWRRFLRPTSFTLHSTTIPNWQRLLKPSIGFFSKVRSGRNTWCWWNYEKSKPKKTWFFS